MRQHHQRDRAERRTRAQLDRDAVAGREETDDVEAQCAGQREADDRRVASSSLLAASRSAGSPMPWSAIASTKPSLGRRARHDDGGVRRRERGRVLEQLGDEVGEVGDRASRHRERLVDAEQLDAGEVGDLGRRRTHDVDERDRLLPLTRLLGARQHEQALGVAAHAGGHVVELEQRVERAGVVLVALEVVEQLELALEQALVATGEVHEQVAHALAEQPRLLLRDLRGHRLDVVERAGELADLVLRLDLDITGSIRLTSPPVRSDSTSCGRRRSDMSRAAAVSLRTGRITARVTNQIRRSVRSIAKTATPP